MFRAHRSSSLSSNPAVSSVASSGGSFFDRSATLSSLSVRSIAVSASGQQKKDRSAWKRLTRKLSYALGTKSKKNNLLALTLVQETQVASAASNAVPDALKSSPDQSSADKSNSESPSPALLELIDAIPVDLPLIRYVAECLLTNAPPLPSPHGEPSKDVESQLFFKSLELKKWTLAQVLAVKIQRRLAFRHQRKVKHDSEKQADEERIQLGSPTITEHEVDDCDVVLSFLDTCSA